MKIIAKPSLRNIWLLGTAGLCLAVIGCRKELLIRTTPPAAQVGVKDPKGKDVAAGEAPLKLPVDFPNATSRYTITVVPPANLSTNYSTNVMELSGADFDALPVTPTDGKVRQLEVKLDVLRYVQIPVYNIIVVREGWVGFLTRSRAFLDVTESGGVLPQRVMDLGEDFGISSLALSPDGTTIVYSVGEFGSEKDALLKSVGPGQAAEVPLRGANLQAVSTVSGGVQHITRENFLDLFPSFTPDGKNLLFSSNRRRPKSSDLLRINATTRGGITDIYLDQRGLRAVKPTQATDGTIAFSLYSDDWRSPGDVEIWTLGGPNQFPTQVAKGIQPQISPDGKRIAYIGTDGNLWVVNIDGSSATQLTGGAVDILRRYKESLTGAELAQFRSYEERGFLLRNFPPFSFPCWSPDGHQIAYTSMLGNDPTGRPNEDIWMIDLETNNNQQLTTNGSTDRFPVFSPDAKWIYFMSNRGRNWAIWRIPVP